MQNIRVYKNIEEFIQDNLNNKRKQFLFVAEECTFNIKKLQESGISFSGAILPQIIFNNINSKSALLACELEESTNVHFVDDMSSFNLKRDEFFDINSLIVILDGLSPNITNFLETLFQILPENLEILGGGAGKLTLNQEPVIFSNDGLFKNSAILLSTKKSIHVGVENGWEYLAGPFIASSSKKNILKSLNFVNAFDIYKKVVEKDSGLILTNDNFFDISKAYPLGIVKFNKEIIVRDPISKNEKGYMLLIGDIEQNSTIEILKGDKKSLILSSGNAIDLALKAIQNKDFNNVMIFDCISRSIYLEDEFDKELEEIRKKIPNKNLFGALTLGEIANNGNEYINFYNKTCVVGILC